MRQPPRFKTTWFSRRLLFSFPFDPCQVQRALAQHLPAPWCRTLRSNPTSAFYKV